MSYANAETMKPQTSEPRHEIEQHLMQDITVKQAKIIHLSLNGAEMQWIMVVSLTRSSDTDDTDISVVKKIRVSLLQKKISGAHHFIPKKWIVVGDMPMADATNVDEEGLRQNLMSMMEGGNTNLSIKEKLRQIISHTLLLPLEEVYSSASFIRLGGDSISAIEITTRCLAENIALRVQDIMLCESLTELASIATATKHHPAFNDPQSTDQRVDNLVDSESHMLGYWHVPKRWYESKTSVSHHFALSASDADVLLNSHRPTRGICAVEFCVAAVIYSFQKTFSDRDIVRAMISTSEQELSRSSILALSLSQDDDFAQTTRLVKDGWTTYQHYTCENTNSRVSFTEMLIRFMDEGFNLSKHNANDYDSGHISGNINSQVNGHTNERRDETSQILPRPLFQITFSADKQGHVNFELDFPPNLERQDDIVKWMSRCQSVLSAELPLLAQVPFYSLSDFPLLPLSYPELSQFISQFNELGDIAIETAYPCSPVQEGILLSQIRSPGSYRICHLVEVKSYRSSDSLDLNRLEKAWRDVVNHHSALRTIFVQSVREGGVFDQVILDDFDGNINHLGAFNDSAAATIALETLELNPFSTSQPAHQFTTCTTLDNHVFCRLDISHALVDGMSLDILFSNLAVAYSGNLPKTRDIVYSKYVYFLQKVSKESPLEYWERYLDGITPCYFPSLAGQVSEPVQMQSVSIDVESAELFSFCKTQGVTLATLMKVIWGTVLRRYTQADDVCFGYLASGRDAPIDNIHTTVGVLINLLICRIKSSRHETFQDILVEIQKELIPGLVNQYNSLAEIQNSLAIHERNLFNTLLSIVYSPSRIPGAQPDVELQGMGTFVRTEYDITLLVVISTEKTVDISVEYQSTIMTTEDAASLANYVEKLLMLILADPMAITTEADFISDVDLVRLTNEIPALVDANLCTHWLFDEQVKSRRDAPAVVAWDRNFTYCELDIFATRLALKLQSLGVGPEVLVPICFPKSAWTVVAMWAIQKAGGAFVPLDPAVPPARLQSIIDETSALLAVGAPLYGSLLQSLGIKTLVIDEEVLCNLKDPVRSLTSTVQPHNASFVIFTSGSTGKPKGIVINHSGTCATSAAFGSVLHIGPLTRVFQFSAYTFDVGVWDMLITIMRGGCICVPSDHERLHNLAGAINDTQANWIFLTPTVADLLNPIDVPGLSVVCLGGEAIRKKSTERWKNAVKLRAIYGPTEASCCAWDSSPGDSGNVASVGRPLSSIFWVVQPDNLRCLVPAGCVGELLVQGPMLARGYLVNDKRTSSSWIENAEWLPNSSSGRVYCTGDIVRSNSNGTFDYLGRKDTQIKLNGQRIELGEIESSLQEFLPQDMSGIVDILGGNTETEALTTFLWFTGGPNFRQENVRVTTTLSENMHNLISHLRSGLAAVLPSYMMPTTYLVLEGKPDQTASGKVDRRALVSLGRAVHVKERLRFSSDVAKNEPPITPMEFKLRDIWAEVLNITSQEIGRNDSFLRLGGDSVGAIKLVTLARQYGIWLTVAKIFIDPRLSVVAAAAVIADVRAAADTEPFSLLPPGIEVDKITFYVGNLCGLSLDQTIEDAYPCTHLQEGLMALAVKQPRSYIAHYVFRLPSHIEGRRFKEAWERTIRICGNLRTRIVHFEGFSIQVVIKDDISWEATDGHDIESFMNTTNDIHMEYSSRLSRYALFEDPKGEHHFFWAVHHAVCDGWTMRTVMQTLQQLYYDVDVADLPCYSGFVKYTRSLDQEAADEYWKAQLHGAKRATFPSSSCNSGLSGGLVTKTIAFPSLTDTSITKATIIRAAWAIILARYCDTNDVCFGTTVSGRHAPVLGIERMAGLALATVPVRVRLDSQESISSFLVSVQAQASDMIAFEQYGLQNISRVSSDAKDACDFSSLLAIQPIQQMYSTDDMSDTILAPVSWKKDDREKWIEGYFTYPLVMQALIMDDRVDLHLTYDSTALAEAQLVGLCHHFEHVIKQLLADGETPLQAVSLTGQWDIDEAIQRNSHEPEILESCVHHLFETQAKLQPDAQAIDAWDYSFTYGQLDAAANRLAHYLITTYSIGVDDLVHVCFEKSAWFIVAILAINKAGAAWVPLDPAHPVDRQRQITDQTKARLALASPTTVEMCASLVASVVEVTPALDAELSVDPESGLHPPIVDVSPQNVAYVLFTSGSTGTPKGCVIQHASVCTNQKAIAQRLGLTPDVRLLQFSSYVFDASIVEIILTLIGGACICVPSEHTRLNSLKEFISDMQINWVVLTPSIAQTLSPEDVPSIELLLLGGEAVGRHILDTWFGKVRLFNGWGPTETCVCNALHEWTSATESPLTIGKPVGGSCWIVDPEDPQKLAPIGCVGEVVIQGPALLREYLLNTKATQNAIMTTLPEWAPRRSLPHWNRFYKTGDLCSYNADGTIEFVSRKDTQVKIRGLRVELSEVEHHMRTSTQSLHDVAVDVLKTDGGASLVSYLCFGETREIPEGTDINKTRGDIFLPLTTNLESQITAMVGYLNVTLPRYMIPTIFIPCRYIPLINSAKIDRNKLRTWTSMLDRKQLDRYSLLGDQKRAPETQMEIRMQKVWAEILQVPAETIGRDDSFLRMGGDSISVIRLVGLARDSGIDITVKAIFDDPRLSVVAAAAADIDRMTLSTIEPFSLLPPSVNIDAFTASIREQCGLPINQTIEDAYPCTQLQEGLMALAVKQPGSYIGRYTFRLPEHVDVQRFKTAWEQTVAICDNLRTQIVLFEGYSLQVLIEDDIAWEQSSGCDVQSFTKMMRATAMTYSSRLSRYALIEEESGKNYFCWTSHHAINDGWTVRIIVRTLSQAYHAMEIPPLEPYNVFIKYTMDLDQRAAAEYWKAQLLDAKRATFPLTSSTTASSTSTSIHSTGVVKKTIPFPTTPNTSITKATILRAAWALILARYCDTDDVCFGTTISGRHAHVYGVERMAGAVLTTVPVRVRLDSRKSVATFLSDVQNQALEMIAYEQYGLQNISKVSMDARDACDFSSLLVIQPAQQMDTLVNMPDTILLETDSDDRTGEAPLEGYFSYPLVIQCLIFDEHIELHLTYDSTILDEIQLTALCNQFANVTQQLHKKLEKTPVKSRRRLKRITTQH